MRIFPLLQSTDICVCISKGFNIDRDCLDSRVALGCGPSSVLQCKEIGMHASVWSIHRIDIDQLHSGLYASLCFDIDQICRESQTGVDVSAKGEELKDFFQRLYKDCYVSAEVEEIKDLFQGLYKDCPCSVDLVTCLQKSKSKMTSSHVHQNQMALTCSHLYLQMTELCPNCSWDCQNPRAHAFSTLNLWSTDFRDKIT